MIPVPARPCAAERGVESLVQPGGTRRKVSGASTYPNLKGGRDKSMLEKREWLEDAESLVLQTSRDTVKAKLPESQSPAVQPHTRCYSVYNATPPGGDRLVLRTPTFDWLGDEERLHLRG